MISSHDLFFHIKIIKLKQIMIDFMAICADQPCPVKATPPHPDCGLLPVEGNGMNNRPLDMEVGQRKLGRLPPN